MSVNDYLAHYGVKGQKHGHRRWQYEDGSLTPEGRVHYGVGERKQGAQPDKTSDGSKTKNTKTSAKQKFKVTPFSVLGTAVVVGVNAMRLRMTYQLVKQFLAKPLSRAIMNNAKTRQAAIWCASKARVSVDAIKHAFKNRGIQKMSRNAYKVFNNSRIG